MESLEFNSYFLNRPVFIGWERIVIPKGDRIFKIVCHFKLYDEFYIIIRPIDNLKEEVFKEIMVKLYEIKSITLV